MKVTKATQVHFTAASQTTDYGMINIPAGLRVREIQTGRTKGMYFLEEFPNDLFPRNSMIRHDAVHYGITLSADMVQEQ